MARQQEHYVVSETGPRIIKVRTLSEKSMKCSCGKTVTVRSSPLRLDSKAEAEFRKHIPIRRE